MISWLLKKITSTPGTQVEQPSQLPPERCALWHDVSRALDAKPKSAAK